MINEKKYFWFKMEDDFFQKKEIKKLRSIAGGDTFVIIYLKIILLSLKTGGKLYFEGIDDDFACEIALEIDEEKNNVLITLEYLLRHSAVLQLEENEYHVNISNLIGTETSTAIRVRKHRETKKMLQCNTVVTPVKQNDNGELELNKYKDEKEYNGKVIELTNYFYSLMIKPTKYLTKAPDLTKWYKHIDDLNRIDKIDFKLIKNVIDFALNDKFWKTNILSTNKLREQFNKLEIQMKSKNPYDHIEDQYPERDGAF